MILLWYWVLVLELENTLNNGIVTLTKFIVVIVLKRKLAPQITIKKSNFFWGKSQSFEVFLMFNIRMYKSHFI